MQYLRTKQTGFTLIEMLVVAPIVILILGVIIGYITALTGQGLQTRQKNALAFDTQASLNDMESIGTRAIAYLSSSDDFFSGSTKLKTPQGKDDNTAAFSNTTSGKPDTLIIKSAATTKSLYDPTRELIYNGTGACNSNNSIYTYMTIYFVANDNALYKRTVLDNSTPCKSAYQRPSCSPAIMASNPPSQCKAQDEKLLDNVSSMSISYYNAGNSVTAANAKGADTVNITLATTKKTAGKDFTYSGAIRFTTINLNADLGAS